MLRSLEGHSERAIFVIDKKGIVRYIDIHAIDEQPSNEVLFNVLREIDPEAARASLSEEQTAVTPLPQGGIVLYCTSWCPDCRRARNWLKTNNINFVEIDIDTNPNASEQVKAWNGGKRVTPTLDVGGVVISNYDEAKYAAAVKNMQVK